MTRAVSFAQTFWLAGYYDDFNHARSVADDANTDLARDHDHILTHYGSILSGDSTLNPRYRYSIVDRVRDTSGVDVVRVDDPLRTVQSHFRTTDDDKLTINRGIHEWLTYNEIMGNPDGIEGRSRLRVPSSLSPNSTAGRTGGRGKFNRFINGHDTGGSYYAPIGSAMEPGHYGAVQLSYNDDLTNNVYAGGYASFVQENTPTSLKQVSTNFAYATWEKRKTPT